MSTTHTETSSDTRKHGNGEVTDTTTDTTEEGTTYTAEGDIDGVKVSVNTTDLEVWESFVERIRNSNQSKPAAGFGA